MAGSITVSSITLDSDNNFSILSNTGATLVSANGTGLITGVANTSLSNKTITNPTVSGNLSLDSTGTTGLNTATANTVRVHTAGVERVRVTSSGDVGIGTSNPVAGSGFTADRKLLQVFSSTGSGNAQMHLGGTSGTIIDHDDSGNTITTLRNLYGASSNSAAMQFQSGYMTFGTSTSYIERMRISAEGYVTKPYQVAFRAALSADTGISNTSFNKIPYDVTDYNINSSFNTTTNRFTAPIAGKYLFCVLYNTYGVGSGSQSRSSIYKNGNRHQMLSMNYVDFTGDHAYTSAIVMNLAASDYIEVFTASDDSSYTLSGTFEWNAFSGYLLG